MQEQVERKLTFRTIRAAQRHLQSINELGTPLAEGFLAHIGLSEVASAPRNMRPNFQEDKLDFDVDMGGKTVTMSIGFKEVSNPRFPVAWPLADAGESVVEEEEDDEEVFSL
jgi:hypothetical protein